MKILPARFSCETHDEPGQCDEECARLLDGMMFDGIRAYEAEYYSYDPTGCSDPEEKPYQTVEYDGEHHVTLVTQHDDSEDLYFPEASV